MKKLAKKAQNPAHLFLLLNIEALLVLLATKTFGALPMTVFCALLLFLLPYFPQTFDIQLSTTLEFLITLLLFGSLVLGESFDFYYQIRFWDDALHTLAGFLFGACGAFLFSERKGLGAISFALFGSSLWEIFEFIGDRLFGTNMQKDSIIKPPLLSSQPQPNVGGVDIGLADTMLDLCFGLLGGVLFLLLVYFACRSIGEQLLIKHSRKDSK